MTYSVRACSIRKMKRARVAVGVIALLSVGCGGVEHEPNLATAIERTEATGSARIEIAAAGTQDGEKIQMSCTGAADYVHKRFRLACDFEGAWEIVVIGHTAYTRSEDGAFLGFGDRWLKSPDEDVNALQDFFSPERLLTLLRAASRQTERIGEEEVRGEPTVRYRLTVNCSEAELISCPGKTTPVDVWIDGDGLVRRIFVEDGGVAGTIEFFDFGLEVDIEPPPADQVADIDELAPKACPGGGRPITDGRAIEAFSHQGLQMTSQDECFESVAADLFGDLGAQGMVQCAVYARAPKGAPSTLEEKTSFSSPRLRLANLECSILFADGERDEHGLRRVRAAFDELERAIRP